MRELSTHRRRHGLSKYVHKGAAMGGGTQGTFRHPRIRKNVVDK